MAAPSTLLHAFNRGEISKLALARVDVDRVRLSAERQINFMPRKVGPMTKRPGLAYLGSVLNDDTARSIPFIAGSDAVALLEFTDLKMRVWVSDALVSRPSVSTAVTSGTFASDTGWTLTSSTGTATVTSGQLLLNSDGTGGEAKARQQVTVAVSDRNVEHALRIVVTRGPVQFRVGSSAAGDQYIADTTLGTGTHSLAFTPTGDFHIQFYTSLRRKCFVDSCTVEGSGAVEITTPYAEAKLDNISYAQSADVMYVACKGRQQRMIERRSQRSWSIVLYEPEDGPFLPAPSENISITPSGTQGTITLTADKAFFRQGHVGALFRLFQTQENITATISAENTFTDPIRITGVKTTARLKANGRGENANIKVDLGETGESGDTVGTGKRVRRARQRATESENLGVVGGGKNPKKLPGTRRFRYKLTKGGSFNGKVSLQRSFDGPEAGYSTVMINKPPFKDSLRDDFDNSVVWYRAGVETGNFGTTGGGRSVTINLNYPHGGGSGVVRITNYSSSTSVTAEVLNTLSSTEATRDWLEGAWSDRQGWPTSGGFFGGRLWWFGNDTCWGSVSDAYESFDYEMEGDAAPVIRTIGEGPVQAINSMVSLKRPILFGTNSEISVRSNALDEPLTPTNFGMSEVSTQGSSTVSAIKVDGRAIFVHKSRRRIFQVLYQVEAQDYVSTDLMALHPELGSDNFTRLAVQRQPETMIHAVRADGTACVLLLEPAEDVAAWWRIETDGVIEDVCVLPGSPEDSVYYVVKRTINGSDKRFLEKFSRLDQCTGGQLSRLADSHIVYEGASTATITGLSHLNGESVVAWGGGKDLGTYTVSGGSITLSEAVTKVCVGLSYDATWKSTKLAYGAEKGTALTQKKRIPQIGLILQNTHYQGLQFGQDFDHLDYLPLVDDGRAIAAHTVHEEFDGPMIPLNGTWDTDARLCLKSPGVRPCTVCAVVMVVDTNDKTGPKNLPKEDAGNSAND